MNDSKEKQVQPKETTNPALLYQAMMTERREIAPVSWAWKHPPAESYERE